MLPCVGVCRILLSHGVLCCVVVSCVVVCVIVLYYVVFGCIVLCCVVVRGRFGGDDGNVGGASGLYGLILCCLLL